MDYSKYRLQLIKINIDLLFFSFDEKGHTMIQWFGRSDYPYRLLLQNQMFNSLNTKIQITKYL